MLFLLTAYLLLFLVIKLLYEILYFPYDINSLRVFGCLCFTSTLTANRKKLDPRAATFVFWDLSQTQKDVSPLNGDLNEEVYMVLLPGMQSDKPEQVCKLQRPLYGLKQASRQCYARLSSFLISHGYNQCTSDYSLFLKHESKSTIALLVYVDDILSGNELIEIQNITQLLDNAFKIKDLSYLKFFLGFGVARTPAGINICKRKYALDILNGTGWFETNVNSL